MDLETHLLDDQNRMDSSGQKDPWQHILCNCEPFCSCCDTFPFVNIYIYECIERQGGEGKDMRGRDLDL